ncbi:MAG TPA: PEP-CTERM sorting domain-containing protein [Rhodanobacteraceae bacterium]|nr:PEP-CTERM sorting domain-containing protein [Rhodanobacteraceae bacterium]
MLTKKSIGAALVCALALGASGVASATMVTVDGVSWDTASPLDLTINALNLRETSVSGIGQVLHGYGQIGSINGNNNFCSGCDLTFTFTYTVKTIGVQQVVFDDGLINFYVSNPGTYDVTDPTTASLGTSWLTLTGHTGSLIGFATTGTLFGKVNGTVADPTTGSSGQGFLDATGGPAMMYVDSNSQPDGLGGFADFSLNSEFQTFPANGCGTTPTTDLDLLCSYPIEGTASLIGKSVTSVPEPAEIGLLGLGLGILGFLVRRRRKETDGRP